MFLLLEDSSVIGFWGNSVGDIFIENTIKNLKLDGSKVKLMHFLGLEEKPEFFKIEAEKLTVQKEISVETPSSVEGEPPVITKVLQDDKSFDGSVFFDKGVFFKSC
jgi:hypothetical protein